VNSNSSDKNFKLKVLDFIPQLIKIIPEKLPHLIMSGIPALLSSDKDIASIGKVLEENALKFGDKNAILFEDQRWSSSRTERNLQSICTHVSSLWSKERTSSYRFF
jgi:hypothetical protein